MKKKVIIIGGESNPSMVQKYQDLNPDVEVSVMNVKDFESFAKEQTMSGNAELIALQLQTRAISMHEMHKEMMKEIDILCADMRDVSRIEARYQKRQNIFRSQYHSRNFRKK